MKKLLALLLLFGIVGCATTPGNSLVVKDAKTFKKSHNSIPTPLGKWELAPSYEDLLYPKVQATNIETGNTTFMNTTSGYSSDCPIFSLTCLSTDPNDNGGSSYGLFDKESVSMGEIFVISDEATQKLNQKIRQFINMKRAQEIVIASCEKIYDSECYLSKINDKEKDFYVKKQSDFNFAYQEYDNSNDVEYPICEGMYSQDAGKGWLDYWDNCWGTAYENGNQIASIFINNKASLYAEIAYSDGSTYKGQVSNDVITGYGTIVDVNKNTYKGNMLNGEMHGKGLCVVNKKSYECNFNKGEYVPASRLNSQVPNTASNVRVDRTSINAYERKESANNSGNRFASLLGEILIGALTEVAKEKIINEFVEPCIPKVKTSTKSSQYIPGAPQYGTKVRTKVTITSCPQQYPFK